MINYKGLFYKEDSKKPNYEGGAHFKYKDLVRALEDLKIKRDEEENDKQYHSRSKSQDYFQEKDNLKSLQYKEKAKLATIDSNNYVFDSPIKDNKNNNYYDQLLSIDKIKLSQKRRIKLKDINSNLKLKENEENVLFTENNRYNSIDIQNKLRNKSLDVKLFNEKNNYKNKILLTEGKYNNNNKNLLNLKTLSNQNPKYSKNLSTITSLPKIESLYFNHISNKNLYYNGSNSNMATNSTNKGSDHIDLKNKLEKDIQQKLKLADFNFFSLKKKLPQINGQSMSIINNNKTNKFLDKNKIIFNANKANKEKSLQNNIIKEIKIRNDDDTDEEINVFENIIDSINFKKNNHKILKIHNLDKTKDKDTKIKLLNDKNKKTNKKKNMEFF